MKLFKNDSLVYESLDSKFSYRLTSIASSTFGYSYTVNMTFWSMRRDDSLEIFGNFKSYDRFRVETENVIINDFFIRSVTSDEDLQQGLLDIQIDTEVSESCLLKPSDINYSKSSSIDSFIEESQISVRASEIEKAALAIEKWRNHS